KAGQIDKAVALAHEQLAAARAAMPADSPQLAGMMSTAGRLLLQAKVWTEAEAILREDLAIREAKEPDAWTTFHTKSLLGGAPRGQKRYAEAEPLLRAGFAEMKQRVDKVALPSRSRLVEALDRLIELAEATNRPEEVKRWKDEKAKLTGASAPRQEAEKK